ncbi:MAG: N-acetylmannosamine-6-phosphate 2-epimerase [Alicyclobacillus herbarius]|uniref:N-acetylmannosamine-6-phosphate 2-epimerase n=1 Tax=Alicyclobacillus herbarius TaxID=122960 RepID=UPI002356EDAE|nr:N-acetylmannosamine-6-phosphate 2-epimerase [Alicyclobacillus herbarius]MCL6632153.1 N-acetylmannosamine-6-phosphate 2-epimerase [Alicyclobacillus herbarius]
MTEESILQKIHGGLIVSCQALENEPLYGADIMARMAVAAERGGAVGIRANGGSDIREIKRTTHLPVIGLCKRWIPGSEVYITPTLEDVEEVLQAGADMVAVDATQRVRPGGGLGTDFVATVKQRFPRALVVADVATYQEGVLAAEAGADIVATTLSGYTSDSAWQDGPDFSLVASLSQSLPVPVIAEGHIRTPRQAAECLRLGAWAVVVGSAITRPQEITQSFVTSLRQYLQAQAAEGEQRA